ncbi:MAG: hypothetical protein LC662_02640, partial [Rhodothermaceae bacterium]|nr:hypothetical protein [Rhodothermaceae bacterium]
EYVYQNITRFTIGHFNDFIIGILILKLATIKQLFEKYVNKFILDMLYGTASNWVIANATLSN